MPERIDSKFRFILLAAERAERMARGAPPKLEADTRKSTQVAMDEIMHDLIEWDYGPAPEDELEEAAATEG
jgi:DNA-directed RNA polymerase omega subunit